MVQNNKVLTVSYGTFSCTLEGFDDSFETMKAIAEYFRDLAAEDRYFGSEPPQPDAEMLARIAQRDASRRVEASQNDHGLVLRATEQAAPATISAAPTPNEVSGFMQQTAPAEPVAETSEPVEETPAPAADSIAAKLQRIRAVVSHTDENSVIYAEDEETTLMNAAAAPTDAVAAAFEAGSLSASDFEDEAEEAIDAVAEDMQASPVEAEEEPASEDEMASEFAIEDDEQVGEDLEPSVDEEIALQEELTEEEPQFEDETSEEEDLLEDDEPAEEEDEPVNILGDYAMDDVSDEQEEPVEEFEEGILTAADEQDLLSEISNVEAFLARRATESSDDSGPDQDVSRLMDKANVQMDDPATSDQRETYSQLRAAVAATEAERKEKAPEAEETDEAEYRDFTSSVSPRRPEIEVTSMRPQSDTLAPLKLVAEQRIDTPADEAAPITPRRVRAQDEEMATEEGGFANYAQEQGAQSLPDLLEAAASYLSFIEGQEQFSRPQLMNKIRSLKQDEFNREESLRSFGQLLRDGKIEKAGGGRFAASTHIGFRPDDDERAAG